MTLALLKQSAFVAGEWIAPSDLYVSVTDPATDKEIGRVPRLDRVQTRRAIMAAVGSQVEWRRRTAKERSAVLKRWFDLVVAETEELARLLTAEQGKPIAEARSEIAYAASFIEWFAEEAKRVDGDVLPGHERDKRILVLKQPVGVVAAITPWNFPAAMVTRKLAPALAAGCGVILKPASQTPFSALALAALAQEAGVPDGLLSVLTGSAAEIGAELCSHPEIRKLTFTGSTEIGRELIAATAGTVKRLSLELGGNAPFIVFEDADLDAAVEGAIQSKFRNAGQTCVCSNRLLVHEYVYDAFAARLAARVSQMRSGPGGDADITIGPLIDRRAVEKVASHIEDAVKNGASLLCGGTADAKGNYFPPTVIVNVTEEMQLAREETFGPVAPLMRFSSEAEAIALSNATEFGLASYFYTSDADRLFRVAEALEFGMVGANTGLISTEVAPFGGIKQSGYGREGSRYGIEDYLNVKYVCVGVARQTDS